MRDFDETSKSIGIGFIIYHPIENKWSVIFYSLYGVIQLRLHESTLVS